MKAKAPEKIYLVNDDINIKQEWYKTKQVGINTIEYIRKDALIEKAVEGRVIDDGGEIHLVVPELPAITRNMDDGDRIKIVFIK